MLVLSRLPDESIMVDDHIEITILKITDKKVKIGIDAPPEVSVHRKEYWLRLKGAA